MRPSLSVAPEPGSEQGAPWGRDLYTFVTSAAGHMMRTLQKPRKNRPSKRQVNHRRFLHNMIQRKFADIEAANQRLASALPEENKSPSSPQPQDEAAVDGVSESRTDVSAESGRPEVAQNPPRPQEEGGGGGEEARPDTCRTTRKNQDQGTERQRSESDRSSEVGEIPQGSTLRPLLFDDSAQLDSALDPLGQTSPDTPPPFSPDLLSPLSLDSCDFSIQMFTDVPPQSGGADAVESPWADILDLFGFGAKDPGGCLDVGAYFQSICDDDSALAGCHGDGHGCHGDQEAAVTQVPESTSCFFNQQRLQGPGRCHREQKLPFEGVAQSFCAPALSSELRPPRVRTPPHEHDWLIPDILMERMTPPW